MKNAMYIVITIFFTVVGQILVKAGAKRLPQYNSNIDNIIMYIIKAVFSPLIFLGLLSAVIAAISWIGAMSKYDISFAYPFMSLSYVFVMILAAIVFKEVINLKQWIGLMFICFGVFLISRV